MGIPGDHFDELLKVGAQRASDFKLDIEECEGCTALRAEVARLSIFHADDEPSWRHRAEALEQEIAALRAKLEEAEKRRCFALALSPSWKRVVDAEAKMAKAEEWMFWAGTVLDAQPDLVRTDTGERGDGELNELLAALAAIREEKP